MIGWLSLVRKTGIHLGRGERVDHVHEHWLDLVSMNVITRLEGRRRERAVVMSVST